MVVGFSANADTTALDSHFVVSGRLNVYRINEIQQRSRRLDASLDLSGAAAASTRFMELVLERSESDGDRVHIDGVLLRAYVEPTVVVALAFDWEVVQVLASTEDMVCAALRGFALAAVPICDVAVL